MSPLAGSRVVLGVCGGIAAYKAVDVCRRMVDAGAHVSVVMTEGATRFVGETTFSALGSEPARTSLFSDSATPIPHTSLGQQADLVVVAPATARLLSAYASGYSHDLLTNVLIATRAPVLVCPAMHTEMWEHPAVQDNMATLRARGVGVQGPGVGRLAGGDVGAGRLSEPSDIVTAAERLLETGSAAPVRDLEGTSVLVTAGGTREAIDPVRFIGNRSSGKQGHAVAEVARDRGAKVVLVTSAGLGATEGIEVVEVESAADMHEAVMARSAAMDVVVMAAAVADFTPVDVAGDKIKKRDGVPVVELRPTVDILAALGADRAPGQVLVGFAAETTEVAAHARAKLESKGADLLVANDVAAEGVGFEHDTNEVLILSAGGDRHVPLTDKRSVAEAILDSVVEMRRNGGTGRR
ncbi:MAG: bifunctional phosphopantothenoylcysteine decarboxylase/phosphopantothenate--cysteine ligase CoaBC [Actinomycetia bacterium]|nr:bifunctional phosphopantothenoylcysteine decarboxylase/phosphopantothenate--cysteine ligase CoaBC [Actinomycetes bacterium]